LPSYRLPSERDRTPLRRRLTGLGLALGVNVVLLLVLLTLGVIPAPLPKAEPGLVVDLLPSPEPSPSRSTTHAEAKQVKQATPRPVPPKPLPAVPDKPKIPSTNPLPMLLQMSSADFAASDISKLPKAGDGSGASDSEVVGRAPNGEVLYAAEWARHPTDAELSGYLPANWPDGYGLVACKTIPDNRVDDCVELENSPPGSHLARAVREAAWQFRVRPPRKNGKPLIGEWVRIRIDYYHAGG
jgi:protein TonB